MSLLGVRDLSVYFGNKHIVKQANFDVAVGEKVAVIGESGSGKSVMARSLMRLDDVVGARNEGGIEFDGNDLLAQPLARVRALRGQELSMIFQEPMSSLNPLHTVGRQITESMRLHLKMNKQAAWARGIELLDLTGIKNPKMRMNSYPHMLSGGQRQRVMIAMALACNPKLLIADEPTTALDVTVQAQILELLDHLQKELGMSILMISHDLNLVKHFADKVCVMKAGEIVEQNETHNLFAAPRHDYTQLLINTKPVPLNQPRPQSETLLQVDQLQKSFYLKQDTGWFPKKIPLHAVDEVSFELKTGETLGIVGESGSGKTTLVQCALRLQRCKGDIQFETHDLQTMKRTELNGLRNQIQFVFQDPLAAMSPRMTVHQILDEGFAHHFTDLSDEVRKTQIIGTLNEVGLDELALERYPHEFSGGQRQRILIARALLLKPKLIALDEPTSALDVQTQLQIIDLLKELQVKHQLSYLIISHDLSVIRALSHHVLVMRAGKVVELGGAETLFSSPEKSYTKQLIKATLRG